jgi:transglutaminase-like putative cysteine protease
VKGVSWRLRIRHVTGFTYAGKAHASYNEARLTPMTTPWQVTLFSQVEVYPPATTYRYYDYWGTLVTAFDLQRAHGELKVVASSLVETGTPKAVEPAPWSVLADAQDQHAEMLAVSARTHIDSDLIAQAAEVVGDLDPHAGASAIASWVRGDVDYVPGSTGVQTSAQEAWNLRKGVCQDIAHLTVALLRARGIPARYVSGYLHPHREAKVGETVEGQSHAWVEWWCGDWVGYDPTNGVPVGPQHVVVARGRDYDDVAPLKGVYNGSPSSHLGVTVEITRVT